MPSSDTFVSRQNAVRKFSLPAGFRRQADLCCRSDPAPTLRGLDQVTGQILEPAGQGWLLLDRQSHRRRAQFLRPRHRRGRDRERPRLPPGRPNETKGHPILLFVHFKFTHTADDRMKDALRTHVGKEIGSLATPDQIRFAAARPNTRSAKTIRRLLKELATSGEIKNDTTTPEDFSVTSSLKSGEE